MKKTIKIFFVNAALFTLAIGCATPERAARPLGNLGDTVNSSGNDFAPVIPIGDPDKLYFTSNRKTSNGDTTEQIWRVSLTGEDRTPNASTVTQDRNSLLGYFAQPGKNVGAIAFLPPVNGAARGFLALSHPPEAELANSSGRFGANTAGGTDIFEFTQKSAAEKPEFFVLPDEINSKFWDSHPAVAARGDSTLLIFSSDRPANGKGFSSPYAKTQNMVGADTVLGNADLYYIFRVNGKWSALKNFDEADGTRLVNTATNEYSPFIYCISQRPTLLFASDRENNIHDIFSAELDIDFVSQKISVRAVNKMQSGADEVNSLGNEIFPFVPYPHEAENKFLYFASDRDPAGRTSGQKTVKSLGGYDLYRFPFTMECRPPKITYNVTILDKENPNRTVPRPVIELISDDGLKQRSEENSASFTLSADKNYSVRGGSLFDKIDCNGSDRVISHYAFRRISQLEPEIRKRIISTSYDTVEAATPLTHYDTVVTKEIIPIADAGKISSNEKGAVQSIEVQGQNLVVSRMKISSHVEMSGGRKISLTRKETVYDTIPRFDTAFVRTTESLTMSELSKRGTFPENFPSHDITISDTIFVEPRYYTFPPCKWEFVENLEDYRRNVPYFQTGFWEVNTSENLHSQLPKFSSDTFDGASFIELHPSNQYFGFRPDMNADEKESRRQKRATRIANYQEFARNVDRNIRQMVENVAGNILPKFEELRLKMPEDDNKMLVQILAYSDVRPVTRGWYAGGENISYLNGNYETTTGKINVYPVNIRTGASLVGANNDTLSKLRAYFGYREVMKRLEKDSLFAQYMKRGEVLFPNADMTPEEFKRRAEKAKIIIMTEGRYTDTKEKPQITGYQRKEGDYYELDDVRRIDVIVSRVEVHDGKVIQSPCCSGAQADNYGR